MSIIHRRLAWNRVTRTCLIILAAMIMAAPCTVADTKSKPTEVPARVIAHLELREAAGSQMLLQAKGDKRYLYVQKASKQGFTVIDVTKPEFPSFVTRAAGSNDATTGQLEMLGPDAGLAEVPDKTSKGVIRSTDNPTETVKVLDLSDPAHPKVLRTFTGVTSILPDGGRGLIFLTNNEGLWILNYSGGGGFKPEKKKRPCGSGDAIAAMPPDCE